MLLLFRTIVKIQIGWGCFIAWHTFSPTRIEVFRLLRVSQKKVYEFLQKYFDSSSPVQCDVINFFLLLLLLLIFISCHFSLYFQTNIWAFIELQQSNGFASNNNNNIQYTPACMSSLSLYVLPLRQYKYVCACEQKCSISSLWLCIRSSFWYCCCRWWCLLQPQHICVFFLFSLSPLFLISNETDIKNKKNKNKSKEVRRKRERTESSSNIPFCAGWKE